MTDRKPRILIAEDFEEVRAPLKLMLKLAGFDPLEAEDGQQAIEIVQREKPDLVLIDITLPIVDGLQATRQIRSDPQFERLPIIIVSAHDNEDIRQQARAAGGTAYLSKPIEFDELKKMIRDCLSAGQSS